MRWRIARRTAGRSRTGGLALNEGGRVIDDGFTETEMGDGEAPGSIASGRACTYIIHPDVSRNARLGSVFAAAHRSTYVKSTTTV
jgi:hypothetical protein